MHASDVYFKASALFQEGKPIAYWVRPVPLCCVAIRRCVTLSPVLVRAVVTFVTLFGWTNRNEKNPFSRIYANRCSFAGLGPNKYFA
jgi:hypothetical protein